MGRMLVCLSLWFAVAGAGLFETVGGVGLEWDDSPVRRASEHYAETVSDTVIAAAVGGGTTVVCRHAITDDFRETEPVDYEDPSTQRRLSEEGERQSADLGRAMSALGVRVTEIVASPMDRARRTAELMFRQPVTIDPIWHTNGGTYRGAPLRARRRALAAPIPDGTRLIVSHIGTISSVIPSARNEMGEGDCVVVRAEGQGHRVVGFVPWQDWLRAAG